MTYVLGAVFVAIIVVLFLLTSWWGGAIALVAGLLFLVYAAAARRNDRSVATIERGRRTEPTGQVRSGSAGVETSNQRQGQE
jgi:heme O synthase-like polyprenyltransferase